MDVMKPPVVWIGNRCYRKNPTKESNIDTAEEEEVLEHCSAGGWNDEACDSKLNIEETPQGFQMCLAIPEPVFKYIIGRKGETKRRLEFETQTQIYIPPHGKKDAVVITGRDRRGVSSAKTRIDVLMDSFRQRQQFTHFLSLPINSSNVKERFSEFKSDVLRTCDGDRGLAETIFQDENKLHVTLGILVLLDDNEVQQAVDILRQCKEDLIDPILRGESLDCAISGLECMNDDPGAVDVLYAKLKPEDGSDRLLILSDQIMERFIQSGFMRHERDHVKLHITVMNTMFRKKKLENESKPFTDERQEQNQWKGGGRRIERESFDASNIFRLFGDFSFGQHHIENIHISERHTLASDGYYKPVGTVPLP